VAGPRGGRFGLAAAGGLAGFAVFGGAARPCPSPAVAAALLLALTGLFLMVFAGIWSPITGEAATAGSVLAVPASIFAAVALRGQPASLVLAGAFEVLAAVSAFAALGTLANAESGWRRTALWAAAMGVPAALSAVVAALALRAPAKGPALVALAVVVALLAWLPVILMERKRVRAELREEVLLGLLPEEDALVLQLPWKRSFEKRFGRADERREYVRSALLLAVARQQQRRRSGDAERLRQLEVLAFRTRIRRTLDARATRHERSELAELTSPPGEG
jgi:hypothetical protein